jgi:FKBP-type peptidyl-prolyl cis-trans isomerase SlyD
MKVAKDLVVSLAYQVRTEDGVLVDESPVSAPLDYLHGHGSLISGLETALEGHEVGDKFDVAVGANDAYGQYDENLVQRVPKDVFMGVEEVFTPFSLANFSRYSLPFASLSAASFSIFA